MKNIIIFGPPGTGKGTVSKKIATDFGLMHISTGDIIRKNQEDKTKIGLLADKIVDQGGLLPDDIVNELIRQEIIENVGVGFIFDGFPRTPSQTRMLDEFLFKRKNPVTKVIHLDCPLWVAQNRIIERGKTSNRKDDNIESFLVRWDAYQRESLPSLDYFESRGKVVRVDGDREIEVVYEEIKSIIDGIG